MPFHFCADELSALLFLIPAIGPFFAVLMARIYTR
jgi:hypothetical protein